MAAVKKADKKKVAPYPFAVSLKLDTGEALGGQVMKVAQTGFIAELAGGGPVKVGQKLEFAFELPALHVRVAGRGAIVKLYNQLAKATAPPPGGPAPEAATAQSAARAPGSALRRLAEIRFEDLPDEGLQRVRQFMAAIGQRE